MKIAIILVLSLVILVGCNSKGFVKEEPKAASAAQTCFVYRNDKDTVRMILTFDNQSVVGELTYNIFEKDGNTGSIRGTVVGDTILATYSFKSEGVKSERDVAFLKKGSSLVEGFAPMDESGRHFANRAELDFTGIVLNPTNCYD